MKINLCPKCNNKGSLIFTTTKRNGRKYSYVQHYDPITKSKKKCNIPIKELVRIKFDGKWYKVYEYVITMIQGLCDGYYRSAEQRMFNPYLSSRIYGLDIVAGYQRSILHAAGSILEKNGYLKYRISERIMWDVIDPEPKDWERTWKDISAYDFVNGRRVEEFGNNDEESLPPEDPSLIKDVWKILLPDHDFPQ